MSEPTPSSADAPAPSAPSSSPYESMRPAGTSAPRVNGPSGRFRGPAGWFLNDVGLKVLALLVAAMMWQLVRGRIQVEATVDVDVELKASDPNVLVGRNDRVRPVTLQLEGTRSDVERVRSELVKNRTITYRFTPDAGASGRVGPVTDPTRLDYPVEDATSIVTKILSPIEATWHRVTTKNVKLLAPLALPAPGRPDVDVDVLQLTDTEVTITAPISVLEGDSGVHIRPDPVDVRPWVLEGEIDSAIPFAFEVGFDDWRAEAPTRRGADLTRIEPARVRGKVFLRQRRRTPMENTLRTLPAGDLDAYRDFVVEVRAPGYDSATRVLSAELRGDPKVLDQMKKEPSTWCYVIALPPPPSPSDPPATVEAEVSLRFEKEAPPGVRLVGKPTVSVTLKKRP